MEEDGVRPTEKFYMALLRATGEGARTDKTIHILQEMREAGLTPGVRSYNCAVGACGKVIVACPCRPVPTQRIGVGRDPDASFADCFVALTPLELHPRFWQQAASKVVWDQFCRGEKFKHVGTCCGSTIGCDSTSSSRSTVVKIVVLYRKGAPIWRCVLMPHIFG